uniref:CAB/ELIP/HLIP superfamily protein n=1 Tax=Undaria pinnatifida TaxID=74381 RepID=A0A0R6M543_UNDPI|nr:hypothetical protein LEIZ173 [Undaria pinnatifida]AKG50053.1 hypothetical protein LEIZ173 [Undaria pinnatifida]UXC96964.1 hypothetical protein ycf17 [Undaria pinnatifida]UXC97102.1 hypothetical protein ycf17 [Undaria pinnatifida]UXC97240.1 hypothetical protein ycf17 [Undaria pinnatifida]
MNNNYKQSNDYESRWGFYLVSEVLNGRVAMIALVIIILLEVFTKRTLLDLLSNLIS